MCSYYIDNNGVVTPVKMNYEIFYYGDQIKNDLIRRYYTGDVQGLYSLCIKIFRNDFIQREHLRIDEKLFRAEDAWFVFECLKVAKSVSFLPENLYYYYQNESSIMHSVILNQYDLWKDNKQRLLVENKTFCFKINNNEFYKQFLYNLAIYIKNLIANGNDEKAIDILKDEFYYQVSKYTSLLPVHIKILHFVGRSPAKQIAIMLYKLWGKING